MPYRRSTILLVLCVGVCGFSLPVGAQEPMSKAKLELLQSEWERNPDNLRIALLLGGMMRREGRVDEANSIVKESMAAAEERIVQDGDSAEFEYLLGTGALFLEENSAALKRFQFALSLQPEREEIHLGLIRALLNLGREDEAGEALELAVTLFPESESIKRQLAEVHERAGRYDQAIPILEELRVLHEDDPVVFNRLLRAYAEAGEVDRAVQMIQRLVDKGAVTPLEAALHMFRIHLAKGDLRAARLELQRASQIEPDHPLVGNAFRDYYAIQAGQAEEGKNYRRAVLFWERALEKVPDDWQVQYRLALAHAALDNHEEALDRYLPLLEKKPADPKFYADLSLTLLALERFEATEKVVRLGFKIAEEGGNHAADAQLKFVRGRLETEQEALGSSAFRGR